jgi:DNA-binding NtrC family response regulator
VEALALFQTKADDFDIVITDMTMPNLTGDKLAAELIQIRPNIPIVLCTGYSKMMSEEKAAKIGIKAFLMKPLTIEHLAKTVRRILE